MMVTSKQAYLIAMKDMIRKVQAGYEPPFDADAEELEVLSDCIKNGYIRGRTTYFHNGKEQELRTLDGKMHPEIINHIIPPKGLAFLSENDECDKPDETDSSNRENKTRKKFYQSGVFWAAVAVFVTITLWCVDRFYFGIAP